MTAGVEIRALTPALEPDLVGFFEGDAFADNPKWASCYCQFLHVDHREVDWHRRTAAENRAACCARVAAGRMPGYLAYRDGKVVGWCNAAPRTMLAAFDDEPDPDAGRIGIIACFVVAKAHRRTGVARSLLEAACAGLAAQGLAFAEAMPKPGTEDDGANHFGPLALFAAAGFVKVRDGEHGSVIVRRALA